MESVHRRKDIFQRLAVDPQGNIFVGGYFMDSVVEFDDVILEKICLSDVFIVRADSNGYFQWGEVFGALWHEYITDIACDKNGYVYVTGRFSDSLSCSIGTLYSSAKDYDFFITKLAPFGGIEWIKDMNTDRLATCTALDIDPLLNVVLAGRLEGQVYILKLSTAGSVVSFQEFGNTGIEIRDVIALQDNSNTVLIDATDSASIGQFMIPSPSTGNIIAAIANIRANGSVRFLTLPSQTTSNIILRGGRLSTRKNKLGVIGQVSGSAILGSFTIGNAFVSNDTASLWMCILDPSGKVELAQTFAANNTFPTFTHTILLHEAGDIYTSGHFYHPFEEGTLSIGPPASLVEYTSNTNAFLLKFNKPTSNVNPINSVNYIPRVRTSVQGKTLRFKLTDINNDYDIVVYDILGRSVQRRKLALQTQTRKFYVLPQGPTWYISNIAPKRFLRS
jgi:hypothetical protein